MKKHNFLLAILCDNDFGRHIKEVLSEHSDYITQDLENNDALIKNFIITQVMSELISEYGYKKSDKTINWEAAKHTEEYLTRKLKVSFSKNKPTDDHDCGSAYLDLHTKESYYI